MNNDIGFQYGNSADVLPDESLATSSNQFQEDYIDSHPRNGRLYKPWKSWCPRDPTEAAFYLELILVQKYYVFAVTVQANQGPQRNSMYMKNFSISYSEDYTNWTEYNTIYTVSKR